MKLVIFKGTLISLCLAVGLGSSVSAATVDPTVTSLTYKLAKGNKLVAKFDAQHEVESWTVVGKTSNKVTGQSMYAAKSTFAPVSGDFGDRVASLVENLGKNAVKLGKTQKNAVLTGMFGTTPPMRSWTRVSADPVDTEIGDDVSPVPVPAGGLLLLSSLGGLLLLCRKKLL